MFGSILMLVQSCGSNRITAVAGYPTSTGSRSKDAFEWHAHDVDSTELLFIRRILPRVRHQGAAIPTAHVAAGGATELPRRLRHARGVLLKMGTYGMLRVCVPLFPEASRQFAPEIAVLAIVGIIYARSLPGAGDLETPGRLLLRSAISDSSFSGSSRSCHSIAGRCLPDVEPRHLDGALFLGECCTPPPYALDQRIRRPSHADARSSRLSICSCARFGGAADASMALSGEFLILAGTFQKHAAWAAWAALALFFRRVFAWSYQRVFFRQPTQDKNGTLPDRRPARARHPVPDGAVILWMGKLAPRFYAPHGNVDANVLD